MLHYNPQHVSSSTMLIFRRTNCVITASGIVTLCKRPYNYAGWGRSVQWRYFFSTWNLRKNPIHKPAKTHPFLTYQLPSFHTLCHLYASSPSRSSYHQSIGEHEHKNSKPPDDLPLASTPYLESKSLINYTSVNVTSTHPHLNILILF